MLLRRDIETQLKDSINRVIVSAGYEGLLEISSVELTEDDIIAEINFSGSPTSFFVRYSDRKDVSSVDMDVEKNLLELVELGDGLTEQFLSSKGYTDVANNYIMLRARILAAVTENDQSIDEILNVLNSDKKFPAISKDNLSVYLDMFAQMGFIETGDGVYKINSSELGQFRAYIVNTLFKGTSDTTGEIGVFSIDSMPDNVRSYFDKLNIGTLIAEPTLSIDIINRLVDLLASRISKSVITEGATVPLTENAQLTVLKSTDSNKLVLHVMNKPSAVAPAQFGKVSESLQARIRLQNYPLTAPVDEKSELVFEIRGIIDEFNAANSGTIAINTDSDYITANPQAARNVVLFMTEQLETGKIDDLKTAQRLQAVEKYFLARDFFASGDLKQAVALIESIRDQSEELNLFTDNRVLYDLKSDIDRLNELIEGTGVYEADEFFFGLDKVIEQTLNLAPPALYVPILLSLGDYLPGDVTPVAGVTDLKIYLKTDVYADEIPDSALRKAFYEEGITSHQSNIFINLSMFDASSPESMNILVDTIKTTIYARNEDLNKKVLSLFSNGLPEDLRLCRFSKEALRPFRPDMFLDDGFSTQDIELSDEDFGMELPVSLNPVLYSEIIEKEKAMFQSVMTLVNESSRMLRAKKRIVPKRMLMQAQLMVANLKHFSPRFKARLMKSIAADLKSIERTNLNKNPLPSAVLLSGRRAGRYSALTDERKDPVTAKLMKAAIEEIAKVNTDLASEIQDNMNVVVGYWPGTDMAQSTVPYNAIYIYPQVFERIKYLAGKEATFELAAIQLAQQLTDSQQNTRTLNIADLLDEFKDTPEKVDEFIEHTQELLPDMDEHFTGEIISYLDVAYDQSGRPFFNKTSDRIVTYFDEGRPIRAWNSKDNKEYYLPIPFEDSEVEGYEVIRDTEGNLRSLKTPSELEKWFGYIDPEGDVFFLAKDKKVVALVNTTTQGVNIVPLLPDEKMVEVLEARNPKHAINLLRDLVADRNQTLLEEGKLWDDPQGDPRQRKWNRNRVLATTMLIPIILLNVFGCMSRPLHNPQFTDPYLQTPGVYDQYQLTDEGPYESL